MRALGLLLIVLSVAWAGGCTKQSEKGGPGATTTTDVGPADERAGRPADTFTISVPAQQTNLAQGSKQDVTVQVNRGSDFKQAVTLKFNAPQGVDVSPTEKTLPPSENKATVTFQATEEASPGMAEVEVTAAPETGKPVSVAMHLDIKKNR